MYRKEYFMTTTITVEKQNELCEAANSIETLSHYLVQELETAEPESLQNSFRLYTTQKLIREQLDKLLNIINIDGIFS